MLYGIFRFDGYYKITLWKGGSEGKESACNVGDPGLIPGQEDPLEKGMATHSSIQHVFQSVQLLSRVRLLATP